MIDLQIEESLSRETLMSIDSLNHTENWVYSGFFLFLLIINLILGFSSPRQVTTNLIPVSMTPVHNNSKLVSMVIQDSFSNLNCFTKIAIQNYMLQLPIIAHIHFYGQSKQNITKYITSTNSILYSTNYLETSTISFNLLIENYSKPIKLNVKWEIGNPLYLRFQSIFYAIYGVCCIVALFMIISMLKSEPFRIWHLEQKLTVFLLIATILYDNPLYFLRLFNKSSVNKIYDKFFFSLYLTYIRFFLLTLFDSLQYKNRQISQWFFLPKIIFFSLFGITETVYLTFSEIYGYKGKNIILLIFNIIFIIWLICVILRSILHIDITERYKLFTYSFILIIVLIIFIIISIIIKINKNKNKNELNGVVFMVSLYVINFFGLIMTVLHWPYELMTDQQYLEPQDFDNIDDFLSLSDE